MRPRGVGTAATTRTRREGDDHDRRALNGKKESNARRKPSRENGTGSSDPREGRFESALEFETGLDRPRRPRVGRRFRIDRCFSVSRRTRAARESRPGAEFSSSPPSFFFRVSREKAHTASLASSSHPPLAPRRDVLRRLRGRARGGPGGGRRRRARVVVGRVRPGHRGGRDAERGAARVHPRARIHIPAAVPRPGDPPREFIPRLRRSRRLRARLRPRAPPRDQPRAQPPGRRRRLGRRRRDARIARRPPRGPSRGAPSRRIRRGKGLLLRRRVVRVRPPRRLPVVRAHRPGPRHPRTRVRRLARRRHPRVRVEHARAHARQRGDETISARLQKRRRRGGRRIDRDRRGRRIDRRSNERRERRHRRYHRRRGGIVPRRRRTRRRERLVRRRRRVYHEQESPPPIGSRATRDAAAVILLCVVSLVVLRRVFPEDEFWARVAFPFDLGAGALRRLFSSAFFFRGVKTTDGGARNTPGYGYYSFGWENPKLGGGGANDAGSFSSGAFFAALWTSAMADVVAKFVAVAAKCASVLVGDWRAERDAKTYSSSSRHHSTSTNTAATRRRRDARRVALGACWARACPSSSTRPFSGVPRFRRRSGSRTSAPARGWVARRARRAPGRTSRTRAEARARARGEAHAALGAARASDRVGERVRLAPGEAEVWVGGGGGGVSGGGGSARADDEGSFANDGASAGKHTNTHARALGDECAICQEPYRDPTRLRCAHVFCEGCVAEWFDRDERTPPLAAARWSSTASGVGRETRTGTGGPSCSRTPSDKSRR